MALWMAASLASSMERDRRLGLRCVLVGTALWLVASTASAAGAVSMVATATTDHPKGDSSGDSDRQSITGGRFGGSVRANATTDDDGYRVPVMANAFISTNVVIEPDQSGAFDVWIDLRAKIGEPGSLRDFPNWPATVSYETIIDLDLPDGGEIAFLGDQRPKVSGNGSVLIWSGGTYLDRRFSTTTFQNRSAGSVMWTTTFDNDGNAVFERERQRTRFTQLPRVVTRRTRWRMNRPR